jgi:hypothetical protein
MPALSAAVRRAGLLCLPFAAVLAVGVTLSLHASADYPGGGSGGSYPGAGWHPPKPDGTPPSGNDFLNTSPFFNSYDWTKLDIDIPNSPTVKYVTGEAQSSTGGVSGPVGAGTTRNIHGTSTIKYQWVPPNNAAGQPDWTNFPAPPLFVLGSIHCSGELSGPADMEGNGHLADGWGWTLTPPMVMPCAVTEPTHRKVLPASGTPATFTLSPSADIHVKVVGPNQVGGGDVILTEFAYPITLSVYDPFVRPDWGDGSTNQTSYDEFEPGRLRIPVEVYIPGASQSDTDWLVSKSVIDVNIAPEPPNALLHFWEAFNDTVIPIIHDAALGIVDGDLVYSGLPYNNNDFGDHTATLQVNSQNSQQAHFQTFFTAVNLLGQTISNYPNTDGSTANWYYYYNQVINPDADPPETYVPGLPDPYAALCQTTWELDPNSPWGYDIESNQILMGPGGINQSVLPVFALRPKADGKQWTTHIGDLHIAGIHSYLRTYLEEATHADQIKNLTVLPGKNSAGQRPPTPDDDLDGVPDADERKYGLERGNPDSTETYQNYLDAGYPGDSEVLAAIVVLGKLLPKKDIWKQDWA